MKLGMIGLQSRKATPMKSRILAALVVTAALSQQSAAQAPAALPSPVPVPPGCDLNALVRSARAVVGVEVRADRRSVYTPLKAAVASTTTGEDCYTLPTCAARRKAEEAATEAAKAAEYLLALDTLRAHVAACEQAGY